MKTWYKIVWEEAPGVGRFKFLFHGVNGSRTIPFNTWLQCEHKLVWEGQNGKKYVSGFHVLPTRELCEKYLERFKKKNQKAIVRCYAKGIRRKEHSRSEVYLADKLFVPLPNEPISLPSVTMTEMLSCTH